MYHYRQVAVVNRYARGCSSYELSKVQKVEISHKLKIQLPTGTIHHIQSEISFPKAPYISPCVEKIASETNLFCERFGLNMSDVLETSKDLTSVDSEIGWFVGMVAPDLDKSDAIPISQQLRVLFENASKYKGVSLHREEQLRRSQVRHDALLAAYQGNCSDQHPSKEASALLLLNEQYFRKFQIHEDQGIRNAYRYSVSMLQDHLNALQSQARCNNLDDHIEIRFYKLLRRDTVGVHHSLSLICLAVGIDFKNIQNQYSEFKYMIDAVAQAVGFLNNYYSAPLELNLLYKQIKEDGDDYTDEHVVKSRIQSNLMLLYWRDGLSIEDAAEKTINDYHLQVSCFYSCKNILLNEIRTNPEFRKATYACESFLFGHASWGAFSGRYNEGSGFQGSPEFVHQKIMTAASVKSTF